MISLTTNNFVNKLRPKCSPSSGVINFGSIFAFIRFLISYIKMLSRKNKDLRTIKEGVVGKYVKKDTPPEMPSKLTKSQNLELAYG